MNATTALVFGLLALLLAGTVPALLSRSTWPYRAPRAALVLWQAVAIAAVLSAFSSGLAIASQLLVPGADGRPTTAPTAEIDALGLPLWILYVVVFALTLLIGAKLIFSIIQVAVRTRRRRARHRVLVDLLDDCAMPASVERTPDLRVLDVDEPIAYCLPGLRQRVVLSQGTLQNLDHAEVKAILTHERSHLRARHDLVLEAFTAVNHAFPRFVRSKSALGSVQLLVELLADDSAVRATGPTPLARGACRVCRIDGTPRGNGSGRAVDAHPSATPLGPTTQIPASQFSRISGRSRFSLFPRLRWLCPWLTELRLLFNAY